MNPQAEAAAALVAALGEIEGRGRNLVTALLDGAPFHELAHYPPDDIRDPVTGAQYYFHAHRRDGSSGHLHCFLPSEGAAGLTHVAAVALDQSGRPARFFTTNLWVTGDDFCVAEVLTPRLPALDWSHASGEPAVNAALTALFALYRHEVAALLRRRDAMLRRRGDVAADERVELLSTARIDLPGRLAALCARLGLAA
ncbi:MAG: hypothetical protein P4L52_02625 [Acidocella sp.]|nr:hypothetical protein [Acidocella sp.]